MSRSTSNHDLLSHDVWLSSDQLLAGVGAALPDDRALSRLAAERHAVSRALAERRDAAPPRRRAWFRNRRRGRAAATRTA